MEWPREAVYIGRGCPRLQLEPSKWGNPFRMGRSSRDEVVQKHLEWLAGQTELKAQVGELTGAFLVCHCSRDQRCHGDNLMAMWREECGDHLLPVWRAWQVYID